LSGTEKRRNNWRFRARRVSGLTIVLFSFSISFRLSEAVMIYYVALPFTNIEGGLAPGQAIECPNGVAAIRRAQAMSIHESNAGAVAFSRTGDPNIGEFDDAVILKTFGEVPDDWQLSGSA
jgi:hypothetical protein